MSTDLLQLLARGKGPTLHWFPEDVSLTSLAATLVGMANTRGGTLLLGIAPRSAEVVGLSDPQAAQDRLFQAALLAEPALVLPLPRLEQVSLGGRDCTVLCASVPAGLPHIYMLDGRYLGREGSQTNPLSARRLRALLAERAVEQFEDYTPPDAWMEDLEPRLVAEYYRLVHGDENPDPDQLYAFLERRGCARLLDGLRRPTVAALLLFGRSPQQFLLQASILAARFPEQSMSDMFIKQDLTGSLPEQLRQAEAFVRANLHSVVRLQGLVHEEQYEIPLEAVREVLVNAVAHRDYSLRGDNIHLYLYADRLEVHSPGGLPGPVTMENLLEARFSRNPVVVQVLSDLGFVERMGYGLKRVVNVMQAAGLRPPRFEEIAGSFRVTLYSQGEVARQWQQETDALPLEVLQDPALNLRQRKALSYLSREKRITSRAYQELCPGVHPETLRRDLTELAGKGLIIKVGDKKATYYILKKPLG